jgi:hypothetical protein
LWSPPTTPFCVSLVLVTVSVSGPNLVPPKAESMAPPQALTDQDHRAAARVAAAALGQVIVQAAVADGGRGPPALSTAPPSPRPTAVMSVPAAVLSLPPTAPLWLMVLSVVLADGTSTAPPKA